MFKLRPTFLAPKSIQGFSLAEVMVSVAIFTFLLAAFFSILNGSQATVFNADAAIDLRNSLRIASEKIALELRNTGYKSNVAQFSILTGQGTGGSDILRFSIPILCSATSTLLDNSGNPNFWGAPLTWGCNSYTCMDADGNCGTLEYKYIQYSINGSNQLERKILDSGLNVVAGSTSVVGNDIVNLQAVLSADAHIITFTLTGRKTTPRVVTATYSNDILMNNLGG